MTKKTTYLKVGETAIWNMLGKKRAVRINGKWRAYGNVGYYITVLNPEPDEDVERWAYASQIEKLD